jgi:transcription elongation factor Elf1
LGQLLPILILVAIIIIAGLLLARFGNSRHYEIELTFKQLKDYFLKKHYCMSCNNKLKRRAKEEYKGEGWSDIMNTFSYAKKYKRIYDLHCSICGRSYQSEQLNS